MKKIFNAPFSIKSSAAGEISCVFATMQVWDHDNDFTERGAFGTQGPVPLEAWNHNYMQLPVGQGKVYEKGNDAIFEGNFFLDTQAGHDHFETLRQMNGHEYPQEFSYSFDILKSEKVTHDGKPGQRLISLKVLGVAPVQRGAGLNTRLLHLKSAGGTWLPAGLSPDSVRRQIESMVPPSVLRASIDAELTGQLYQEISDLSERLGEESPRVIDVWTQQLQSEGHSKRWIQAVINIEFQALERRILAENPNLEFQPGAAHRLALQMISRPFRPDIDGFPEAGAEGRSPSPFV